MAAPSSSPCSCTRELVTVDLSADQDTVLASTFRGCSDGFFYVSNHGVSQALIDAAFEANRAFVALPQETKDALAPTSPSTTSGYRASGTTCVGAKGQKTPESREMIRIAVTDCDVTRHSGGWPAPAVDLLTSDAADGVPLWPEEAPSDSSSSTLGQQQQLAPAGWKATVLAYFAAVNGVAEKLLQAAAGALGLPADALTADDAHAHRPAWQTLSMIHYPALASVPQEGRFAAAAHKDRFCMFTVLANTPGSKGLEALTADGLWYEVPPKPGCFIVNVGSLLELWSGGRFPASVHRVVNYEGNERYSIAFFRGNAPDTTVRPLLPPVSAGDAVRATADGGEVATDCTTAYRPVLFGEYMKGFNAAFKVPVANAAA